jgi:nucleoside-diphosphate-sugar epimerase
MLPGGVEFFYGLLDDSALLSAAMQDVEAVVHLAAKVERDSREIQEMRNINADGARNVYIAALAKGCKFFLHMSSAGVYGSPRGPLPFREDDASCPVTPYQVTKWEAEQALCQIAANDTTLNILRPAGLYGPGSLLEIPAYKKVLARRWSLEPKGGVVVHPTHVRDIVEAVIALIDRPASHQTVFNIGAERLIRVQDLLALQAEILDVRRRRIVVPTWIATPLAGVAKLLFAVIGRPKPLLADMYRGRLFCAAVDDRRFRQSYPAVPVVRLADGLREHLDWARMHQLI